MSKQLTFYALGISYKKADAAMRGKFSLNSQAKETLLMQAKANGLTALLLTSTCNRTEIYGFASHSSQLIHLLCNNSKGTLEEFDSYSYVYKNHPIREYHMAHTRGDFAHVSSWNGIG